MLSCGIATRKKKIMQTDVEKTASAIFAFAGGAVIGAIAK
jgi:hypothetical protein